ncbi:MAG TPA: HAD-IIIA family hydrolase [Tepidisphaeraceae bacterium]|nr:HAD-IIIA family hydrolase [Tepidisphaeraceae bacterium]
MKRPAVFFDRDNTLIACDEYLGDPAKVALTDGAADAVARARRLGYATIIFSNQSGVARGYFSEEAVHAVNQRLDELLRDGDAKAIIDRHEFCPYHPDASIEKYRQDSPLRKPAPGMIHSAAEALALDQSRSWVIGDAPRDIEAGRAAGCRTILFTDPTLKSSPAALVQRKVEPDYICSTLKEAIDFIDRNTERAPEEPAAAPGESASAEGEPAPAATTVAADAVPSFQDAATSDARANETADRDAATEIEPPAPTLDVAAAVPVSPPREEKESPTPVLAFVVSPKRDADADGPAVESASPAKPAWPATPSPAAAAEPPTPTIKKVLSQAQPRSSAKLESLANEILHELRRHREQPPTDFSVSKLMAGVVQVLVLFVLFLAFINRTTDSLMPLLIFALTLQTMTIALLIMGKQR